MHGPCLHALLEHADCFRRTQLKSLGDSIHVLDRACLLCERQCNVPKRSVSVDSRRDWWSRS